MFLGLTYGCARCHDHKFDPILQADYYRLQAFFANTAADDHIPMLPADQLAEFRAQEGRVGREDERRPQQDRGAAGTRRDRRRTQEYFDKYPPEIQAMILKPPAQRNPFEWQMYAKAKPYLEFADEDAAKQLQGRRAQDVTTR